jgi:hypothetical protein
MTIAISGTTGITLDGQFNSASSMGFKNRIINGAMVIDQRNAGASVTIPATTVIYTLDRWFAYATQASKFTIQQNAGSVTPPSGFSNYLGCTVGASANVTVGTTDTFTVRQYIEGFNTADLAWGTASAATVTLSFWVRSSLTGTFSGALANGGGNRSYPFTYTISSANTWEQKSVTIAGDTTGTWATNNTAGVNLYWNLGTGSTYSTTAGAWAAGNYVASTGSVSPITTNSATWYITGVQLEKGSTATSFDYRPYGTELALCQRYYYKISGSAGRQGVGYAKTTTTADVAVSFPVTMRTNPSALEQSGTASDYLIAYQNTATACSSVPTFTNASVILGIVNYTVSAVLTAGNALTAGANSANSYLAWSAEL